MPTLSTFVTSLGALVSQLLRVAILMLGLLEFVVWRHYQIDLHLEKVSVIFTLIKFYAFIMPRIYLFERNATVFFSLPFYFSVVVSS